MKRLSLLTRKRKNKTTEQGETSTAAVVAVAAPPAVAVATSAVSSANTPEADATMTTQVASSSAPFPGDEVQQLADESRVDEDHEDNGGGGGGEDDEDDDDEALEEEAAPKEWDEGGKSHCGYSDQVHDTLMLIGESIHKVVGDPNETVHSAMKGIGSWFQEASYAARDVQRGKMNVGEEAVAAIKSMVTGDADDDVNNNNTKEEGALLNGGDNEEGVKGSGGEIGSSEKDDRLF